MAKFQIKDYKEMWPSSKDRKDNRKEARHNNFNGGIKSKREESSK